MRTRFVQLVLVLIFTVLAIGFYFGSLQTVDTVFLTISTFLFTIFTGFFIARQGTRYSKIREVIASFDGEMSSVYRFSGHLGKDFQKSVGQIAKSHYGKILDNKAWDYHFTQKSETITSIHTLLENFKEPHSRSAVFDNAVRRIASSLASLQKIRKQMVTLYQERIDHFQWFLVYFFMIILVFVVATLPSEGHILSSILKAAFAVSVISVVVILHNLDDLKLFEGVIGEHSAQDVLDIIDNKK